MRSTSPSCMCILCLLTQSAVAFAAGSGRSLRTWALRSVCAATLPALKKLNLNLPMRYSDKFYEDILASEQCRAKLALRASRRDEETHYVGALASRLLPPKEVYVTGELLHPGRRVARAAAP